MSEFDAYAEKLRTREDLINSVSNEQKLEIYALFKQGSGELDLNFLSSGNTATGGLVIGAGDVFLGGVDFDNQIVDLLLERFCVRIIERFDAVLGGDSGIREERNGSEHDDQTDAQHETGVVAEEFIRAGPERGGVVGVCHPSGR
jgi:hypothetical protein